MYLIFNNLWKMNNNEISYVELKTNNIDIIKKFYSKTFWWKFKDFWWTYTSFSNSWIYWWFEITDREIVNWVLVVLYFDNLDIIKKSIIENWWVISEDIFTFPWGSRFHFIDPVWNELAIWSDK